MQRYIKLSKDKTHDGALPPHVVKGEEVPAVLLAAGQSRRLGRPKALVEIAEKALILRSWEELCSAGCAPVVVVVNNTLNDDIVKLLPHATLVINPRPEEGRTGSLQCGLTAIESMTGKRPQRVVMAPVDRPGWNANVVKRLLEHDGCVAPTSGGRHGHPVVMDSVAIETVLTSPPDASLRELTTFMHVEVDAPWLGLNVDTTEDLAILAVEEAELRAYFEQGEGI